MGSVAAAIFVWTINVAGQAPAPTASTAKPATSSPGAPTEKPFAVPKTPWGEPDIQGMFNFCTVGSVGLERCGGGGTGRAPADLVERGRAALAAAQAAEEAAAKARGEDPASGSGGRGGRGGGRGGGQCDPNVAFRSEEAYQQALAAAAKRVDGHATAIAKGNFGQALQSGVTDPTTPQRQTSLIMDPPDGRLPPLTAEGNRQMMLMKSSWAWYRETLAWDALEDFDVGIAASPAAARLDVPVPLQQRHADRPGAGLGDPQPRDDSRGAHHLPRTAARPISPTIQVVAWANRAAGGKATRS